MHEIDRCRNSKLKDRQKNERPKSWSLLFPKLLGFNFIRNVSESVWINDQTKVLEDSIGRYTYICSYISPTMISSMGTLVDKQSDKEEIFDQLKMK